MRTTARATLVALVLVLAPAGTAISQNAAEQAAPPAAAVTTQAQDDRKDDDGDAGLWGLFGLLGLAGLIPWRKNRDRQGHRDSTRSTGM